MRVTGALLAVAASLVLSVTGSAMAQAQVSNSSLKGAYKFNQTMTCAQVFDDIGFGDVPDPFGVFFATGGGDTRHISLAGITIYDGKGAATTTLDGILLFSGPYGLGSPAYLRFNEICDATYTANKDGSFTQTASCKDANNNPPAYTISNIIIKGQLDSSGSISHSFLTGPEVQKLKLEPSGPTFSRICAGTGSALRTGK